MEELFKTQVTDDVLGTFKIGPSGDPIDASGPVVSYTFFEMVDPPDLEMVGTLAPMPATVEAALGGAP